MPSSNYSAPYVTGSSPAKLDTLLNAGVIDGLDAAIFAILGQLNNLRIQRGTVSVVGTGALYATASVTFPIAFSAAPTVIFGNANTTSTPLTAMTTGTTSTTASVRLTATSTFSSTYSLPWFAIGAK